MNKDVLDKLVKFGLITNVGVCADKYNSIEDLITSGVITIPGAREKIYELVGELESMIDNTIEKTVETIKETHVVEEPVEEPVEIVVEETEE